MYRRNGLGKEWYESLLDVVAETGATVMEGQYGKTSGDAIRGFHKGWTGAAFGPSNPPPPPQPPRPQPQPQPYYAPQPQPQPYYAPQPQPMPFFPSAPAPSPPLPSPQSARDLIPRGTFEGSASLSGHTIVLLGGLGVGALVLVYLLRRRSNVPR